NSATLGDLQITGCPAGDLDSLSFLVQISHGCECAVTPNPAPWQAILSRYSEPTAVGLWEWASTTDVAGDTLEPVSLTTAEMADQARFISRRITGSALDQFNLYWGGQFLRTPYPPDTIRSLDLDTENRYVATKLNHVI